MTKVLVLDSCVFRGTQQAKLIQFAGDHCLVLSYVLGVECIATQNDDSIALLQRFQDLIRAGAYCGRSPLKLCEEEKRNLSPARTIIDLEATDCVRKYTLEATGDDVRSETQQYRESVVPIVAGVLQLAEAFYDNITLQDLLYDMRQETDRPVRLRKWIETVDRLGNELMARAQPDLATHWTDEWYVWHDARLRCVLALDWACMNTQGGMPGQENALHDFHDMQHVTYLSKADGLLTRDIRLVEPLTRAAFPNKDLFSDISQVTSGYRFGSS